MPANHKNDNAEVGYKNVPDSKTGVLRTKFPLPIECEARHGGTRNSLLLSKSRCCEFASCAGIENTRHDGVPPSVLRTHLILRVFPSEGRLSAGHTGGYFQYPTTGYFQPPISSQQRDLDSNNLFRCTLARGLFNDYQQISTMRRIPLSISKKSSEMGG